MAPPPASPCTRTHTRALPVHPLQVDGEWQTEAGTIPFCGALSALPSDAVQAESQVCTRMHTYAHVCITHELWSVSYAVYALLATPHKSILTTSSKPTLRP